MIEPFLWLWWLNVEPHFIAFLTCKVFRPRRSLNIGRFGPGFQWTKCKTIFWKENQRIFDHFALSLFSARTFLTGDLAILKNGIFDFKYFYSDFYRWNRKSHIILWMQQDWRTKYRKPDRNGSFRSWEIWIYLWVMRFFITFFPTLYYSSSPWPISENQYQRVCQGRYPTTATCATSPHHQGLSQIKSRGPALSFLLWKGLEGHSRPPTCIRVETSTPECMGTPDPSYSVRYGFPKLIIQTDQTYLWPPQNSECQEWTYRVRSRSLLSMSRAAAP